MTYKPTTDQLKVSLSIVQQMAKTFGNKHRQDQDELYSLGLEKLAEVIGRYDTSYKAPFTAWIRICIRGYMLNYIRDKSRLVRMPRKELYAFMRMQTIAKQTGIRDQKVLARLANVSPDELAASEKVYNTSFISDSILIEQPALCVRERAEHTDVIDFLAGLTDEQLDAATKFFEGEANAEACAKSLSISQDDFYRWATALKAKCNMLMQRQ